VACVLRLVYLSPAMTMMGVCRLGTGPGGIMQGCDQPGKGVVKLLVYDSGAVYALWCVVACRGVGNAGEGWVGQREGSWRWQLPARHDFCWAHEHVAYGTSLAGLDPAAYAQRQGSRPPAPTQLPAPPPPSFSPP
jgi:hypothetical protein